jgi:uncharacterized protein
MKIAKTANITAKNASLRKRLKDYGKVLVAFSGGKDSFFLLQAARETLGPTNVLPYFARTPFTLGAARERVDYFKNAFSLSISEIAIDLLQDPRLRQNSRQRCYYCKTKIFGALKKEARRLGIGTVVDGTTASDLSEHRPGRAALEKSDIRSPLRDAGFSGAEIAGQLRKQGVDAYFLTSSTCLATRFPYDFTLEPRRIEAIGRVECHLIHSGIYPVRVRHLTDGVRIETPPANFRKLIRMKDDVIAVCRKAGFTFITLDLAGIKSGCWDEFPTAKKRLLG